MKVMMDLKHENTVSIKENSTVLCKHCGKQISENVKFCNFCGQPTGSSSIKQEKKFCVHCGKEILREAKFCNFCGKANKAN